MRLPPPELINSASAACFGTATVSDNKLGSSVGLGHGGTQTPGVGEEEREGTHAADEEEKRNRHNNNNIGIEEEGRYRRRSRTKQYPYYKPEGLARGGGLARGR